MEDIKNENTEKLVNVKEPDAVDTVDELVGNVAWTLLKSAVDEENETVDRDLLNDGLRAYNAFLESAKTDIETRERELQREHEMLLKKLEIEDRVTQREHEMKLKKMEIDSRRESEKFEIMKRREEVIDSNKLRHKELIIQTVGGIAKVALTVTGLVLTTALGWKNENDPIHPLYITSSTTKETRQDLRRNLHI